MRTRNATERFVQHLIECQPRVYAYVLALLADADLADEVVSETNLVLWRKADEFVEGTDFGAWACTIARYQVLAARQKLARDKVVFDDDVLASIAQAAPERTVDLDDRRRALRHCLRSLSLDQQQLIQARYAGDGSVQSLAARLGRSVGSISQTLYRLRNLLLECIQRRLTEGGS
jgi:RNA polymerase sigma-70 factor (ECF subfamily)